MIKGLEDDHDGDVVRHNHPSTTLRVRYSRESSESRFRQLEKNTFTIRL